VKLKEACNKARQRGNSVSKGKDQITFDQGDIADIVTAYLESEYPLEEMPNQDTNLDAFYKWQGRQGKDRQAIQEAYSEGINS